jgi:ABC-type dipeptide/oligopeptide/nickel transport system permease subunit
MRQEDRHQLGIFLGLIAGNFKGKADTFILRFMDALLAFPYLMLAKMTAAILGPGPRDVLDPKS